MSTACTSAPALRIAHARHRPETPTVSGWLSHPAGPIGWERMVVTGSSSCLESLSIEVRRFRLAPGPQPEIILDPPISPRPLPA